MELSNQLIFLAGALFLTSILATVITPRLGVPLLLIFLIVGMLAGEDGPGGLQFDDYGLASLAGTAALAVVLFDGGMRTTYASFRLAIGPAVALSSVGVLLTTLLVGAFAAWMFDLSMAEGMLIGAIVGSTDAAAVFSLLHTSAVRLNERVTAALEIESGTNDPMAVFLTIALLQYLLAPVSYAWPDALLLLVQQMGLGAIIGIFGSRGAAFALNRLELSESLYPLMALFSGFLLFGFTGLLGGSVTWARPDEVAEAIRPDTGLVLLETPANPTLATVDIARVVAQAAGVPVAVDNTFATPILQNPLDHGAAYAIHSATKALGGHGDVTGGVVACSESLAQPLRQVRILTGALLDPQAAWLLHRGLPTLALRVNAAQDGACTLAQRLALHPDVIDVRHPSLPGQDPLDLVPRQMAGPGQMIAFRVRGGYARAARIVAAVDLITPAVSLGSVDTLIQHPAGLTHRVVDAGARDAHGIGDDLLRLSVGIEHPDDLWHDLTRALAVSAPADRPLETASR